MPDARNVEKVSRLGISRRRDNSAASWDFASLSDGASTSHPSPGY